MFRRAGSDVLSDKDNLPGSPSKSKKMFRKKEKNHKGKDDSKTFREKMIEKHMSKFAAHMHIGPNEDSMLGTEKLQKLEAENTALASRCRKLEAQNIIAAAQAVDILAITIGLVTAILCYYLYFTLVWRFLDFNHVSIWVVKPLVLVAPYFHNKYNYGITYRRFQVFAVAFVMMARIKLVRRRCNRFLSSNNGGNEKDLSTLQREGEGKFDPITEDDVWEANYEINARFLYSSILRLRGLWTKTAQYISSRADFVPVAYVRELSKLQDEAPNTPWSDVKVMLSKAGILDKFSRIDEEPLASASIGQVHVGYMKKTDEKVVIKVQHPFALKLLSDDFISLRIISRIVSILEPEYKFLEILMNEWAVESRKELDFRTEVKNLESASKSVEKMSVMVTKKGTPFSVEVPTPMKALSSQRVMVMNFCEGKRVDDLQHIEKCNVSRECVMDAVAQVFAHMMYVTDIFNGDPHAGNIFLRKNPQGGFTITLLDWGLAKRLPNAKREAFCQMTYGVATFDFGLMMDSFKTMGLKLKRENVAEDMEGIRFLLRDMAPREKARNRVKAKMKTDINRSKGKKKGEKVPMESSAYPGEFFFFVRTNELLHGLGTRLGVELKYLDLLKPYAEKGLRQSKLYRSNSLVPDPLLSEKTSDFALKSKVESVLDNLEKDASINGAQVCVIKDGKTLTHNIRGNLGSLKNHIPCRSDTLFLGFSVTKATAATLANKMVELGYLTLDERICESVWPAFCPQENVPEELLSCMKDAENISERWAWKRKICLRQILTHSTGLWFAIPANLTIKSLASCEHCTKGFEYDVLRPEDTILPIYEPGSKCTYQYLSFGWLVAGCVIGAYQRRHKILKSYKEIYEEILGDLHSKELQAAGYFPFGEDKDSGFDLACVENEVDLTKMIQMRREAEAMGETLEEIGDDSEIAKTLKTRSALLEGIKGREFVLDPRIWNSEDGSVANVPSAGGRFSAKGIALFYQELGNGHILKPETLEKATKISVVENSLQELQGQTSITGVAPEAQTNTATKFGLGYQLITIDGANSPTAFGHAGVGGSIGFHHKESNTSVGIMFNKVGTNKQPAKEIIQVLSKHLSW